ncbi:MULTISPECIES: hypothetical protein [unclassified Halorhabdus]|uniref:hypothetical protein n=1 Tax=unclassified Halorhabdus TaxID=2621901 RepID=UPI0023DB1158|nr:MULTISPECIES: hypothetical protein [unclassified Halorhabdus]WEL18094.1 Uncharacterized protein SVXHr_1932 [Halorhabdus sp. SVX81]WEL21976.1 Uncharacterized protein HBNXHr_1920 [Halorhabdus sp. BNX81]
MAEETVQCWLVERDFYDEDLVTLVYATPDGSRAVTQQRSTALLMKEQVTAAIEIEPDRLEPVDGDEQERYAREAERMAEQNEPDDPV